MESVSPKDNGVVKRTAVEFWENGYEIHEREEGKEREKESGERGRKERESV